MKKTWYGIIVSVGAAALLWFYMFSPWTQGWPNFWAVMSVSACILTTLGLCFTTDKASLFNIDKPILQIFGGIMLAFALWCVFWVGDKASAWMFPFARGQVDLVYGMKTGSNPCLIGALLLILIGPAEELFWRGYVQRTLSGLLGGKRPEDMAFLITTAVYALVHVWSLNFMLVMAALVAGAVWGLAYRLCTRALPALVISHSLWDCLVFVILPI